METWLIIGVALLLVAALVIATSPSKNDFTGAVSIPSPEYVFPANFQVFNYFPNHSVRVEALNPTSGESVILVDDIKPLKTKGIVKDKIVKYLQPGNVLRIYTTSPEGECKHFSDQVVDGERNERIKNLHIGMITTRFIGNTTDGLRMSTLADNAIQGHAWLVIHNLTEIPLRLNDDIIVAPHSTERYLGYLHQGITLGMIFKDQDCMYPDFQYLNPHSDLYYGVVSDLRQPLLGPFQLEYNDDCDTDQTLWPFELGQM